MELRERSAEFLTGVKLVFTGETEKPHLERSPLFRLVRRLVPTTSRIEGHRFLLREGGCCVATPLLLALVLILIGAKMLLSPWLAIGQGVSLGVVAGLLGGSVVASGAWPAKAGGGRRGGRRRLASARRSEGSAGTGGFVERAGGTYSGSLGAPEVAKEGSRQG